MEAERYDIQIAGYRVKFNGRKYWIWVPEERTLAYSLLFCKLGHAANAQMGLVCDAKADGLNIIHMIEALKIAYNPNEKRTHLTDDMSYKLYKALFDAHFIER